MNNQVTDKSFSSFLPIALIGVGIIILLGWNLFIVVNQHSNGVKMSVQQDIQLAQATQAETKLKQMMSDLVDLAKENIDAETIVKRHGITFTPPPNVEKLLTPSKRTPTKTPTKAAAKDASKKTEKKPVEKPADQTPIAESTDKTPVAEATDKAPVEEPDVK